MSDAVHVNSEGLATYAFAVQVDPKNLAIILLMIILFCGIVSIIHWYIQRLLNQSEMDAVVNKMTNKIKGIAEDWRIEQSKWQKTEEDLRFDVIKEMQLQNKAIRDAVKYIGKIETSSKTQELEVKRIAQNIKKEMGACKSSIENTFQQFIKKSAQEAGVYEDAAECVANAVMQLTTQVEVSKRRATELEKDLTILLATFQIVGEKQLIRNVMERLIQSGHQLKKMSDLPIPDALLNVEPSGTELTQEEEDHFNETMQQELEDTLQEWDDAAEQSEQDEVLTETEDWVSLQDQTEESEEPDEITETETLSDVNLTEEDAEPSEDGALNHEIERFKKSKNEGEE